MNWSLEVPYKAYHKDWAASWKQLYLWRGKSECWVRLCMVATGVYCLYLFQQKSLEEAFALDKFLPRSVLVFKLLVAGCKLLLVPNIVHRMFYMLHWTCFQTWSISLPYRRTPWLGFQYKQRILKYYIRVCSSTLFLIRFYQQWKVGTLIRSEI